MKKDLFFMLLICALMMVLCLVEPFTRAKALPEEAAEPEPPLPTQTFQFLGAEERTLSQEEQPQFVSLGIFKATAYCPCEKCCGKKPDDPWYGITATGTVAEEGRTLAVDPTIIPYGTTVYINGQAYVAEDCGSAIKGNRVDIFFEDHEAALEFGVQSVEILTEKGGYRK